MVTQKSEKNVKSRSVAKNLSSMMLTLLQKKRKKVYWMSIEILASKLPDVMGTGVYHTQFSVAYFLVSTLLSKIFDVGDRYLPVLTSGNWVIKGWVWVIKWPVKLRTFFNVFLSKSKKNMTFYFFEWLTTFSRTRSLSRLDMTPDCMWRTDRRTDRQNLS